MPLVPRLHFFEIDDQSWFPSFLREKVQASLTLFWVLHVPVVQPASPSVLVSRTLHRLLGPRITDYTYVDFCAGAGGPTPEIERELNARVKRHAKSGSCVNGLESSNDIPLAEQEIRARLASSQNANDTPASETAVDFVLTDIAPHGTAWVGHSFRSATLHFANRPIDASAAPADLLTDYVCHSPLADSAAVQSRLATRPPFRLFFLAFHHFDDPLARAILKDTLADSSGFGIFELQDRNLGGLLTVLSLWPLMLLVNWWYFRGDWAMLFFTYVVPIVPFVVVFDGLISCLRTRTGTEIQKLIREVERETGKELSAGWRLRDGGELHTYTGGKMTWFVGVKE